MDNLKQLTMEHHRNAERQEFVKELLSGKITKERYAIYLNAQHAIYNVLEVMAHMHGLLDDMPRISRASAILEDYYEVWSKAPQSPPALPSVKRYLDHLLTIQNDPAKLLAHIYVRHMGDLSGGQMIAKKVPGNGRYYKFNANVEELKNKLRAKLDDSLADEAKICFEFATELFQDMSNV
jgi:heme oxygenase